MLILKANKNREHQIFDNNIFNKIQIIFNIITLKFTLKSHDIYNNHKFHQIIQTAIKLRRKKKSKYLNHTQENTNISLMKMTKTIQDLTTEFNEEIKALQGTQDKTKMKLKNLVTQLEISKTYKWNE